MKINKYPDGTSYVDLSTNYDSDMTFITSFTYRVNSYEDLWHLNQIVDVFNGLGITPDITIPNLIDAQADRRFKQLESSGLKLVCNFLNNMDANFSIYHPHNSEVVEALINNVSIIDNYDFIIEVLNDIGVHGEREAMGVTLMSADAGGYKPLMKLCEKLRWNGDVYSASKSRVWDYAEEKSIIKQFINKQDFEGQDILIVDDISVYGGTFKGLAKMLRDRNCGKLYLAVSHMTVQNLGEDPVTNYFDKVFTTNSKFDKYTFMNNTSVGVIPTDYQTDKLEIIKLFAYDN